LEPADDLAGLSVPELPWVTPGCALPEGDGIGVPGLGCCVDGAACGVVVVPELLPVPEGALVPEPVPWARAGPPISIAIPAIAIVVNHRCLIFSCSSSPSVVRPAFLSKK
jgi:hypothetical protein